ETRRERPVPADPGADRERRWVAVAEDAGRLGRPVAQHPDGRLPAELPAQRAVGHDADLERRETTEVVARAVVVDIERSVGVAKLRPDPIAARQRPAEDHLTGRR